MRGIYIGILLARYVLIFPSESFPYSRTTTHLTSSPILTHTQGHTRDLGKIAENGRNSSWKASLSDACHLLSAFTGGGDDDDNAHSPRQDGRT